jgi:hypothetical protein
MDFDKLDIVCMRFFLSTRTVERGLEYMRRWRAGTLLPPVTTGSLRHRHVASKGSAEHRRISFDTANRYVISVERSFKHANTSNPCIFVQQAELADCPLTCAANSSQRDAHDGGSRSSLAYLG